MPRLSKTKSTTPPRKSSGKTTTKPEPKTRVRKKSKPKPQLKEPVVSSPSKFCKDCFYHETEEMRRGKDVFNLYKCKHTKTPEAQKTCAFLRVDDKQCSMEARWFKPLKPRKRK